jgi:hypothetical protein
MTTLRAVLSKSSVGGAVAILFAVTACGLAWRGEINGETFVGLLAMPLAYLFRNGATT